MGVNKKRRRRKGENEKKKKDERNKKSRCPPNIRPTHHRFPTYFQNRQLYAGTRNETKIYAKVK
jgi:hypothetical protein